MRIFISYSRHNRDVADTIADDLRARGADVFIDYQRLSAGDSFPDRLRDEIIACDTFVLLMSAHSAASGWVRKEHTLAQRLEKRIVPIKLDDLDVRHSHFWEYLDLDWVFWDGEAVDAALNRIGSALGLEEAKSVGVKLALPRATQASSLQEPFERPPFEPETVLVPAGPFLMGRDPQKHPQGFHDELPQHTVTLPDYHIGKYPVTVGGFRAFIEAGGYAERRFWTAVGWQWRDIKNKIEPYGWRDAQWAGSDRLPVIGVSWYEAVAYARWLSDITGRDYRLPAESEWEKAARGTEGRLYPWGDEWREGICNTSEAGIGHTSPVGFSPVGDSPYGAADMAGNVWEWCATTWQENYTKAEDNTPDGDTARVVRGGSWNYSQLYARAVYRSYVDPHVRYSFVGFRVVCVPHLKGFSDH